MSMFAQMCGVNSSVPAFFGFGAAGELAGGALTLSDGSLLLFSRQPHSKTTAAARKIAPAFIVPSPYSLSPYLQPCSRGQVLALLGTEFTTVLHVRPTDTLNHENAVLAAEVAE